MGWRATFFCKMNEKWTLQRNSTKANQLLLFGSNAPTKSIFRVTPKFCC